MQMAIIWNSMNNYLSRVIQPLAVFNKYTDALIMGFVAHFSSHYECSVQNLHFKYRPCQIFPTLSFDWCFQKLKIQRHKKHKIMHGHLLGKERAKKEKKREFGKKERYILVIFLSTEEISMFHRIVGWLRFLPSWRGLWNWMHFRC